LTKAENEVFEAKKQGEESPFSYLVEGNRRGSAKGVGGERTNRQIALDLAYKLAPALAQEMAERGEADSILLRKQVFELAEDNLAWLTAEG
jgi:hypothetical protein